ncbi:hypothetical protein [Ekhidna sp.]|uniref:hypothetical protein n=1 Tax=Ekhidna sp. TaxID=2608089 RepID=UPI003B5092E3
MTKRIFTLAGMHRSGTSLVANWFHDSGIFMGNDLLEAASTNMKGHFEDVQFLELHKNDLRSKGFHQSGLLIKSGDLTIDHEDLAKDLIKSRTELDIWGWKEPRTTLYLRHWKKLIPELKVISIYRPPEYVIMSLYRRLKKGKWYYTRNPIKKLIWYLDIDLNRRRWVKVFSELYYLYNKMVLEFNELYPDDSLIINLNQFIEREEKTSQIINDFLGKKTNFVPFSMIYDKSLLKQSAPELPLPLIKKSKDIFRLLEGQSA